MWALARWVATRTLLQSVEAQGSQIFCARAVSTALFLLVRSFALDIIFCKMVVKSGKRAQQAADKEAEVIMNSLSRASEAAVANTLDGIVGILKANAPLMYHISALLHNPEWTAVLEASLHRGGEPAASSGDNPAGKGWKLRQDVNKIEHLDRHES